MSRVVLVLLLVLAASMGCGKTTEQKCFVELPVYDPFGNKLNFNIA